MESCVGEGGEEEEIDEGVVEGDEGEKRMMGTRVMLMREPSKLEVQEALGMGMPVRLSFLKCGPSMISCRR